MIVEVTVVPNSRSFSVEVRTGRIRICLRSPPENNRANLELVKELSRALGCSVRILSGTTSRRKRLELDIDASSWDAFLRKDSF